jgi:hypothetical protein
MRDEMTLSRSQNQRELTYLPDIDIGALKAHKKHH